MIHPEANARIVIVGAGCFGISTGLHLVRRGFTNVTVLDRSGVLPAPDAASSDYNRIVRSSYSDVFYTKLAREAIRAWKEDTDLWGDTYHESGVVVLSQRDHTRPGTVTSSSQSYLNDEVHDVSSNKNPSIKLNHPEPYSKTAVDSARIEHAADPGENRTGPAIPGLDYAGDGYDNDIREGARVQRLPDAEAIRSVFPPALREQQHQFSRAQVFGGREGYLNLDGGWANASQGLALMIAELRNRGGMVSAGKSVCEIFHRSNGDNDHRGGGGGHIGSHRDLGVHGDDGVGHDGEEVKFESISNLRWVKCMDGSVYEAELVVLAVGSWTVSAFPELGLDNMCLAIGQCVAMIQLTEQEAKTYKGCPVVLDFGTGFYVFPPNAEHIVKMAIHSPGYTHTVMTNTTGTTSEINKVVISAKNRYSTPRTMTSHPEDGLRIPVSALRELRNHLRQVYPDLAEKPFSSTRLCWYNDSPDGDWVIGAHPQDPAIFLATAGSGHAYKFLPVIGRLVADAIQGVLDPAVANKLAPNRQIKHADRSRTGEPQELDPRELCKETDLVASTSNMAESTSFRT